MCINDKAIDWAKEALSTGTSKGEHLRFQYLAHLDSQGGELKELATKIRARGRVKPSGLWRGKPSFFR